MTAGEGIVSQQNRPNFDAKQVIKENNMTAGEGIVSQQNRPNFDAKQVIKEKKELLAKGELPPNPVAEEMKDLWAKLNKIEAKEKCLRVQFLDWLSDKLLNWSNRVHVMSSKIDSPCLIEVAPRKKEESKHAKETKELARLRELLDKERTTNDKLRKEHSETASNMLKEFAELQKEMKK